VRTHPGTPPRCAVFTRRSRTASTCWNAFNPPQSPVGVLVFCSVELPCGPRAAHPAEHRRHFSHAFLRFKYLRLLQRSLRALPSKGGSWGCCGGEPEQDAGSPRTRRVVPPPSDSRSLPTRCPQADSSAPSQEACVLLGTSESNAGSQSGLQKYYALISERILNASFQGQHLTGNGCALAARSPIPVPRHRRRAEQTGALLASEQ